MGFVLPRRLLRCCATGSSAYADKRYSGAERGESIYFGPVTYVNSVRSQNPELRKSYLEPARVWLESSDVMILCAYNDVE